MEFIDNPDCTYHFVLKYEQIIIYESYLDFNTDLDELYANVEEVYIITSFPDKDKDYLTF